MKLSDYRRTHAKTPLAHARSKFVLSSISNLVCTYRIPQESEDVEMLKSDYLGKVTIEKIITIMNKI